MDVNVGAANGGNLIVGKVVAATDSSAEEWQGGGE